MKETVARHIAEQVKLLREEFKGFTFDFHSCFFFNPETQRFQLHRKYQKQTDERETQFLNFKVTFIK
jgi:hypothetical protein